MPTPLPLLRTFKDYQAWLQTVRVKQQYSIQDLGDRDCCYRYQPFIARTITSASIYGEFWNKTKWESIQVSKEFGAANLEDCAVFLVPNVQAGEPPGEKKMFQSICPIKDLEDQIELMIFS